MYELYYEAMVKICVAIKLNLPFYFNEAGQECSEEEAFGFP